MPTKQRNSRLSGTRDRRGPPGGVPASVGFLARRRRLADRARRTGRQRLIVCGAALLLLQTAHASSWQPVESLQQAAEDYLEQRIGDADGRVRARAGHLDPRMQLPRCPEPLEAFLQRGAKMSSRMIVGVRCNGERPWKIFVTVDVVVTEGILVAARTLPRGHVLAGDDLTIAERDVAALSSGYLSSPADAVGRRLKHALIEGRALAPRMLTRDVAVRRGQSVTLTVRSKTLAIRMEGKALMDGSVNQRIRVENTASRRIVEGIVRSPEHVEVLVF